MDFPLQSKDSNTQLLLSNRITTWEEALQFIRKIPYRRNTNRDDFSLVLTENKGTCSSKHAFLKEIAHNNCIPNVDLVVGIYKMNENNTKIGSLLSNTTLDYIPEAHCYLRINNHIVDVTTLHSEYEKIQHDLLMEVTIEAHQVVDYKIQFHQDFIKEWILKNKITATFEEIWTIREKCIQHLSN